MIRLEMTRKQEAILAAIIIFAALGIFILYLGIGRAPEPEPEPEPEPAPPPLSAVIDSYMDNYDSMDNHYRYVFEEGNYTLNSPLIIVDPYGSSPLTALVMFKTEEPSEISVNVKGKTEEVSVSHTFEGYDTVHNIPVYGLYPDMANIVEITARTMNPGPQSAAAATHIIRTSGIPEVFAGNFVYSHAERADDPADPAGIQNPETEFYFTHVSLSAFDINGDYRWLYHCFGTMYPSRYTDYGTFRIIVGSFEGGDALLLEINMLGRVLSMEPAGEYFELSDHGASYAELRPLYGTP